MKIYSILQTRGARRGTKLDLMMVMTGTITLNAVIMTLLDVSTLVALLYRASNNHPLFSTLLSPVVKYTLAACLCPARELWTEAHR